MAWKIEDRSFVQEAIRRGVAVEAMIAQLDAAPFPACSLIASEGRADGEWVRISHRVDTNDMAFAKRRMQRLIDSGVYVPKNGEVHWRVSFSKSDDPIYCRSLAEALRTAENLLSVEA